MIIGRAMIHICRYAALGMDQISKNIPSSSSMAVLARSPFRKTKISENKFENLFLFLF
jgi:hypothetical protein